MICSSAWSDERIALHPYVGKYVGADWEAPVTHTFRFEGKKIIGQIVYNWEGMNYYEELSDLVLDGNTLTGKWMPNASENYKYEFQFDNDFKTLQGQYGDEQGERAKISGTIMSMSDKILEGQDICAETNNYRCVKNYGDPVRVLTVEEFFKIFDGKVYKTGSSVGGGAEFLIDRNNMTLNVVQKGNKPQTLDIAFERLSHVCFNRGSGECVADSIALLDFNKDPVGGILIDTFNIMYVNGRFFDCGVDYIDQGKLATPRDCLLDPSFENFKTFGNGEELIIRNNEFALIK